MENDRGLLVEESMLLQFFEFEATEILRWDGFCREKESIPMSLTDPQVLAEIEKLGQLLRLPQTQDPRALLNVLFPTQNSYNLNVFLTYCKGCSSYC